MELTDLIEKTKNQPEPKNNTEFKKLEKNIEFCKDRITDFLTEIESLANQLEKLKG